MAPWILPPPAVCTNIGSAITKKHDNPIHIKSIALQHVYMYYQGFQRIYTDSSQEPTSGKTGAAIHDPSGPFEKGYRCTDNISVYSTEMIALIAALKHIHNRGYQRTVVLSDSLYALQTLQTYQTSRPDLLHTVLTLLHKSTQCNQHIQFQCISSHVGIQGYETVDNTAKQALSHNNFAYNIPLGVTEIYSIIHRSILDMYKTQLSTNTKLTAKIKPNPCTKPLNYHSNIHYDQVF
jgi:ribonuclease HI